MAWRQHDDQRWQQIHKSQPFRRLIPNMITLAGLCCGLSAIRFAFVQDWEKAVAFIIVAALLDGLDGRAARLLRATSLFGAQLDSLSDFLCFGVAPALVLYLWEGHNIKGFGWAVTLFFACCCAMRLARFNTAVVENKQMPWQKKFFVGVPSPAGGIMCMLPLILSQLLGEGWNIPTALTLAHMMVIALLMVSRLPTFAAKHIPIRPQYMLPVTIACVFAVVMLVIEPWLAISAFGIAYLFSIPLSIRSYRTMEAEYRQGNRENIL